MLTRRSDACIGMVTTGCAAVNAERDGLGSLTVSFESCTSAMCRESFLVVKVVDFDGRDVIFDISLFETLRWAIQSQSQPEAA